MEGKRIRYSFSPGLVLRGVVLYIYEKDGDGNAKSYIVERKGFGKNGPPVTVKADEIISIED